MGELEDHFQRHTGRMVTKWRHYFEIYERHFAQYRGRPVRLVEFGIWHGGSLQLWRKYLGPEAHIVGVDRNAACSALAEPGTDIFIGDQSDAATHRALRERYGTFDIVIDDGGHRMDEQVTTFRELYPALSAGGVYLVEDVHTSYHGHWGGGLRRPGTFVEFAKQLIDQLHAWHGPPPGMQADYVTQTAFGLHFYPAVFVVEKRRMEPPQAVYAGAATMPLNLSELMFIVEMDLSAGRKADALEKLRIALDAAPGDNAVRAKIRELGTT